MFVSSVVQGMQAAGRLSFHCTATVVNDQNKMLLNGASHAAIGSGLAPSDAVRCVWNCWNWKLPHCVLKFYKGDHLIFVLLLLT